MGLHSISSAHQVQNAAIALATIERLRVTGMPIPDSAIVRGLNDVKWPARVGAAFPKARPLFLTPYTTYRVPKPS